MGEVMSFRERGNTPRNALGKAKVPSGQRTVHDDDEVSVYDERGREVERGIFDESAYKYEDMKWNEKDKNYDLKMGYKLVVR